MSNKGVPAGEVHTPAFLGCILNNFLPSPLLLKVLTGTCLKGTLHCVKTLLQRGPGRNKTNISALLQSEFQISVGYIWEAENKQQQAGEVEPRLWGLPKVSCLQELTGHPALTACRGRSSSLECAVELTEGLQCECSVHSKETWLCVLTSQFLIFMLSQVVLLIWFLL